MRYTMLLFVLFATVSMGCFQAIPPGPVVIVTASYPGANAKEVEATIAAPIEQQINGVEGMERLESESRNDGSYIAYVRFKPYTNPNLVLTLVQNRVALAQPMLPAAVQSDRIVVKVKTVKADDKDIVSIAIVDRDQRGRDILLNLSETVRKRLLADGAMAKPEIFPGPDEKQVYVQIDREKCNEYGVRVSDIVEAMKPDDKDKRIEALKTLSVKAANGESIELKKLATLELVNGPSGVYRVNMYPAVRITGSLPEGKTVKSAASHCEELVDKERKSQSYAGSIEVLNVSP
jgi:multidrug efflux pump subunit AcrB